MNSQPKDLDARIDRVLNALRDMEAPIGLEDRIRDRLAHRTQAHAVTNTRFAALLNALKVSNILSFRPTPYIWAVTSVTFLLVLSLFVFRSKHSLPAPMQDIQLRSSLQNPDTSLLREDKLQHPDTSSRLEGARLQSRHQTGTGNAALAAGMDASRLPAAPPIQEQSPTYPAAIRLTITAHSANLAQAQTADDPDTIALNETLAPSHPAPPMHLTAQERLLMSATRRGAPIELAELEQIQGPALRASAEAREMAGLQQFARNLLAPLALAQSLSSSPQTDASSPSEPEPSSTSH